MGKYCCWTGCFAVSSISSLISPLTLNLAHLLFSPNHPIDGPAFIPPSPLPLPPRRAKPATPPPTSLKRSAPDDEILELAGPSVKRAKTNGNESSLPDITSPSKKRRLEEDGLIMMESQDDKLEDDVIEID